MKNTVSFNLEEDIVEKIEIYQKKHNLSSRSAALERIILSMNNTNGTNMDADKIIKMINSIQDSINNKEKEFSKKEIIQEKNTKLNKAIKNCFDEMPD